MIDKFSIKKIPHSNGIKNSLRNDNATTAMIPPIHKLPVSPMKTRAGYELNQRKPIHAPTKAEAKITISPECGMYIIFR